LKIALIASLYAPHLIGGAERVAQQQAEGLAVRDHSVHVLTLGEPDSGIVMTNMNNVDVIRVGIHNLYLPSLGDPGTLSRVAWHVRDVYSVAMAKELRTQLARLRPDVVVCHNLFGWSAAAWSVVKSLELPLVQVVHDQYLRCIRSNMFKDGRCASRCLSCRLMRLPHKKLSRLPDAAVGVSRWIIDSLFKEGYFEGVPVRTHLHNVSRVDARVVDTPALDGEQTVFGYIGALAPGKGVELLLSVFAASPRPHWRLLVAGTGEASYVAQLRARHRDARITFLGRQEPADFYRRLDAAVVPSLLDEALGNVVFESLTHGRPVIASRRGGIPEMVEDGISGLLFDPEADDALALALEVFDSKVAAWRQRSPGIKERYSHYCDADAWVRRWEELLLEVAGRDRHLGRAAG
jgi:glycosyltransferase involved in cell wall biosynthesis